MKTAIAIAAFLALASCTYGEQTGMLELEYVVADDGSKAAITGQRYVLHRPTGIAAFPDGGKPKVTDQVVDVYVVDLASRKLLYRHAIDPPGERSMSSLSTWPLGWKGDDVYVQLTGCESNPGASFKGCDDERRKTHVYKVSRQGVEPAGPPSPPLRRHKRFGGIAGSGSPAGTRSYLSTVDGVWIRHGARGPREQILRVDGQQLEQVVD